jgi:hypothetical protein
MSAYVESGGAASQLTTPTVLKTLEIQVRSTFSLAGTDNC